jgi:hypothetical protein
VAYLSSSSAVKDDDGFVAGAAICAEMALHGFFEDQVRHAIRRLALKRLLETPYAHYREIKVPDQELPDQFHYRATSIGIYHIRFWTGSFAFLDATSTDTPIFDELARAEVTRLAASFETSQRYQRADCFRKYLENQWHLANINALYFDFASLIQSQADTFASVKQFLDRRTNPIRR